MDKTNNVLTAAEHNGKRLGKTMSILIGLVEMYSKMGKPIGSQTLKDGLFPMLSPATIRNHLSDLECMGYIHQVHTSGGRVPTNMALKLYCNVLLNDIATGKIKSNAGSKDTSMLIRAFNKAELLASQQDTSNIHSLLEHLLNELTRICGCIGVLSVPTFEQDFVADIKLVRINVKRVLAVVMTHFGFIDTETISVNTDLSEEEVKQIAKEIKNNLSGAAFTDHKDSNRIQSISRQIYGEISVRYVLKKSFDRRNSTIVSGLYQITKAENYFDDESITNAIHILEEPNAIKLILSKIQSETQISTFIGKELLSFINISDGICVVGAPYMLRKLSVGSVMLITSKRTPLKKVLILLNLFQSRVTQLFEKYVGRLKIDLKPFTMSKGDAAISEMSSLKRIASDINIRGSI